MVRKAANLLLTMSFSGCLSAVCRNPSLSLMKVIQVIIDTQYLEKAAPFLDDFVCKMTSTRPSVSQAPPAMFQAARAEAEAQVTTNLCAKLDEFFEFEGYDWNQCFINMLCSKHLSYLTASFDLSISKYKRVKIPRLKKPIPMTKTIEPMGHASPFIADMIAFLNSSFQSFSYLLPNVALAPCKKACEHIANFIYRLILSDETNFNGSTRPD